VYIREEGNVNKTIAAIRAREVLDSRGNPTLEVEVTTVGGASGRAIVPSGASTGIYEAVELRDGGPRYHGKGVLKAISSVEIIAEKLLGLDVGDQESIDRLMIELDGTQNKARLGGNSILGVSLASAKAAAAAESVRLYEHVGGRDVRLLPVPFFNVINGGQHAGNDLDFQEFMIAPIGASSFAEALRIGSEVYHCLKGHLKDRYGDTAINVGDEGGFSPPLSRPEEALDAVSDAIEEMGYSGTVYLAMDVAASAFFEENGYTVAGDHLSTEEMIDFYTGLVDAYPLVSIEDPLQEEDFEGFAEVTRKVPVQIVGDDLFVTTAARLRKGIELGACNALLWKVNQVGTLTEAIEAASIAYEHGYKVMASHRSGDTEDTFVADLAVAIGCDQIKTGAPARGERTSKYNQLLRIEDWLGDRARFPSKLFN
jgi:enolase